MEFLFLACGLIGLGLAIHFILLIKKARQWRQIDATLIQAELKWINSPKTPRWKVYTSYEYQWKGRLMKSERYSLMNYSSGGRDSLRELIGDARPGDIIKIYCNTEGDGSAIIKLPPLRIPIYIISFSILFIIMGLISCSG